MVVRIDTIRDTSFVASGYAMARIGTMLVLAGLLVVKIDPWYESAFLVGVIAWFLSYLILLIQDLDNPFDYAENGAHSGQEVSLKTLDDLEARLARRLEAAESQRPAVEESAGA
jgi:hypothetical protein